MPLVISYVWQPVSDGRSAVGVSQTVGSIVPPLLAQRQANPAAALVVFVVQGRDFGLGQRAVVYAQVVE